MAPQKSEGEVEATVGTYLEMQDQNQKIEKLEGPSPTLGGRLKSALWHGGSAGDAWFSAASNQVCSERATFIYTKQRANVLSENLSTMPLA